MSDNFIAMWPDRKVYEFLKVEGEVLGALAEVGSVSTHYSKSTDTSQDYCVVEICSFENKVEVVMEKVG